MSRCLTLSVSRQEKGKKSLLIVSEKMAFLKMKPIDTGPNLWKKLLLRKMDSHLFRMIFTL